MISSLTRRQIVSGALLAAAGTIEALPAIAEGENRVDHAVFRDSGVRTQDTFSVYTQDWGVKGAGIWDLYLDGGPVSSGSVVVVSAGQGTLSQADFVVRGVVPYDYGVAVRLEIRTNSPTQVYVYYMIGNAS